MTGGEKTTVGVYCTGHLSHKTHENMKSRNIIVYPAAKIICISPCL